MYRPRPHPSFLPNGNGGCGTIIILFIGLLLLKIFPPLGILLIIILCVGGFKV